jgi:hypothetical protein
LELIDEVIRMRDTKGKEYANSEDRFGNFRRLSGELGLKDYQIAYVYLKKHLDSISSYIKNGTEFSTESIRGRFVDAITYLTLITGMIEESKQIQQNIKNMQQIIQTGQVGKGEIQQNNKIYDIQLCNVNQNGFCCSLKFNHSGVHIAYKGHKPSAENLLCSW